MTANHHRVLAMLHELHLAADRRPILADRILRGLRRTQGRGTQRTVAIALRGLERDGLVDRAGRGYRPTAKGRRRILELDR